MRSLRPFALAVSLSLAGCYASVSPSVDARVVDAGWTCTAPPGCRAPGIKLACEGGVMHDQVCPSTAPDCDARTGECVPTGEACGDGVVHPGEECDVRDTMVSCDTHCRRGCRDVTECPAGLLCIGPIDVDRFGAPTGHCAARQAGLEQFLPCTTHEECATGYCDPQSGRCNQLCSSNVSSGCGCDVRVYARCDGRDPLPARPVGNCLFGSCESDADCTTGRRCALVSLSPPEGGGMQGISGLCGIAHEGLPLGAACTTSGEPCENDTCIDGRCTRPCSSDANCAAPLPHCGFADVSGGCGFPPEIFLQAAICVR